MALSDVGKKYYQGFVGGTNNNRGSGVGQVVSQTNTPKMYKSVIPRFLYKPPYGYPRKVNIPQLRRLAKTPYVDMVIRTIVDELAAADWDVVPREEDERDSDEVQSEIEEVKEFLNNPNVNNQSFEYLLRQIVRDILEVESGVLVKVFDQKDDLAELWARDGATFLKNPDIYGTFENKADIIKFDNFNVAGAPSGAGQPTNLNEKSKKSMNAHLKAAEEDNSAVYEQAAYFQYGWQTGARPIPFGQEEVVYITTSPRSDSIYAQSPIESLAKTLQMLLYGIEHNLEYYTDNNIPKGVLQLIDATDDQIEEFRENWFESIQTPDNVGNFRKKWHKMPIINKEGKFEQLQFSNAELELLDQQEFFQKQVWAVFGVTPSELGMDESPSRAHEVVQSKVFRRRALIPIMNSIEYYLNNEVVWMHFSDDVEFQFDRFDIGEEKKRQEMYKLQLENGVKTPNEIRDEMGMEQLDDALADQIMPGGMIPDSRWLDQDSDTETVESEDNTYTDEEEQVIEDEGKSDDNDEEDDEDRPGLEDAELDDIEAKALEAENNPLVPSEGEVMDSEDIEEALKFLLNKQEEKIIELLESEGGEKILEQIQDKSVEAKDVDENTVDQAKQVISLEAAEKVTKRAVRDQFISAFSSAKEEFDADQMSGTPDQKLMDFMSDHAFENVKDLEEEVRNDLRGELERGLIQGESVPKLQDRVKNAMDVDDDRAQAIARTETNRAEGVAREEAAKQSEIELVKRWNSHKDQRTSEICERLDGQMVEMGEDFKDPKTGETFNHNPAHVNCRSSVDYVPKTELSENELSQVGA